MRNSNKSGDFNLDEELRSKIVADEEASPISDDHEELSPDIDFDNAGSDRERELELKYHIII